jgi:ABC-type Fe3+ transport system permease subunit
MSSEFYFAALVFFSLVFVVFYSIAHSVLRSTWEHYQSYQRKGQPRKWSQPRQPGRRALPLLWLLLLSLLTAWLVVHFVIRPV